MKDKLTVAERAAEWDTTGHQLWRWRMRENDPLPYSKAVLGASHGRVEFDRSKIEAWRKRNLEPKAVK